MLENRSFDHALGSLAIEGREVDGIDLSRGWSNTDLDGRHHKVSWLDSARASSFVPGPPHGPHYVREQVDRMHGFVRAYQRSSPGVANPGEVMCYLERSQLPMTYFLADHFTVCDHWFSAVPSDTIPNRLYSLAGDAGHVTTTAPRLSWIEMPALQSIFERIRDPNDWAIFTGSIPLSFVISPLRVLACNQSRWHALSKFQEMVLDRKLPKLTWIEPTYYWEDSFCKLARHVWVDPVFSDTNDDHPPSHVEFGQELIRYVYDALTDDRVRDVWEHTVLILAYDEHGGFYDHVQPPAIHESERGEDGFTHRGPRVPALVVSPLAQERGVCSEPFDHCSILRFLCDWLGLPYWTKRIASRDIASIAHALTDTPRVGPPPKPTHAPQRPTPQPDQRRRVFHGHVPQLVTDLHRITYQNHREAYERVFPHARPALSTRMKWWFGPGRRTS
jgi:phospholipase C